MLFEHLAPISVACSFLPAFLIVDALPAGLVSFSECDALQTSLMRGHGVSASAATDSDETDLKLFVESLGTDNAWKANSGGSTCCGEVLDEVAT